MFSSVSKAEILSRLVNLFYSFCFFLTSNIAPIMPLFVVLRIRRAYFKLIVKKKIRFENEICIFPIWASANI